MSFNRFCASVPCAKARSGCFSKGNSRNAGEIRRTTNIVHDVPITMARVREMVSYAAEVTLLQRVEPEKPTGGNILPPRMTDARNAIRVNPRTIAVPESWAKQLRSPQWNPSLKWPVERSGCASEKSFLSTSDCRPS